mgnify:CR=1 FL=1
MAYSLPYTFDNMTRIGHDSCYTDQKDIQNNNYSDYLLVNYFARDCTMMKPIELATSQPGIVYNGTYYVSPEGCNVDESSKLQIGTIQTSNKCRISLFERPFATVPFLGRGSVNPVVESQIMQGELQVNKKSVNPLSEKSHYNLQSIPLLPTTKERMSNYSSAIYNNEHNGLMRGGFSTKDYYNDVGKMTGNSGM